MLRESAIIAAFSFCALAQSEVPRQRPVQWGKQSGPFQLSIASDKDEYRPGEVVRITVTLKNVASHPVQHEAGRTFYTADVRVPSPDWLPWRPQARLTPLGERARYPAYDSIQGGKVQPGAEMTSDDEISKLYDMRAPGKYTITYVCKEPPEVKGDPVVVIVSNEITVTILKE